MFSLYKKRRSAQKSPGFAYFVEWFNHNIMGWINSNSQSESFVLVTFVACNLFIGCDATIHQLVYKGFFKVIQWNSENKRLNLNMTFKAWRKQGDKST